MELNVIFMAGGELFGEVWNEIARRYPSDHHVRICPVEQIECADSELIKTTYLVDKRIFRNEYEHFYSEPIGSDVLDKMAKHDSMVYEIMERRFIRWNEIEFDTFQKRKDMYHRYIRFAMYILKHHKINLYCGGTVPHEPLIYIIYCLCKELGIPTIMVNLSFYSPNPNTNLTCFIEDIDLSCAEIKDSYNTLCEVYKNKTLDEIELNETFTDIYNNLSSVGGGLPKNDLQKSEHVKGFPTRIKRYLKFMLSVPETKGSLKTPKAIFIRALEELRFMMISRYYKKISDNVNLSDKYIYFALQYEPECTLAPASGFFSNQLLTARILSASLPEGVYLYIKEHPAQNVMYNRGKYFYDELKKLKGVKLLDKSVNTIELQAHAVAVATGIGTAGWECQFLGTPALLFGSQVYMYAPGAYKIRTFQDCVEAIKDIETGRRVDIKSMKIFLKSMESISFEIPNLNNNTETSEEEFKLYLDKMKDRFLIRIKEKIMSN